MIGIKFAKRAFSYLQTARRTFATNPKWKHDPYTFGKRPNTYENALINGEEGGFIGVFVVGSAIFIAGICYGGVNDRDDFHNWALKEAIERDRIVANGGFIEYGRWYSQDPVEYKEIGIGQPPIVLEK